MKRPVIYTDLDGSLLDHYTYEATEALPLLRQLEQLGTPVIPCTSKTRRRTGAAVQDLAVVGTLYRRERGPDLCTHKLAYSHADQ